MPALIDVNIFEDVVRRRQNWESSYAVLKHFRDPKSEGCVAAWTVAVIYYFRRRLGDAKARQATKRVIRELKILDFTAEVLDLAFADQRFSGFEDAIQFHTAKLNNVNAIITRNVRHFRVVKDEIAILTPEEFLAREKLASE